jgi:hypothetical protein
LLYLRGLANAISCLEVWPPKWDDPFACFCFQQFSLTLEPTPLQQLVTF